MRALLALLLFGCAPAVVKPTPTRVLDSAPQIFVDSPTPGSLVHQAEVEVRGRIHTRDGRGWVWVESTQATVEGDHFVAHHVPLREGKLDLPVELTDSAGDKARKLVPLIVETHDRPRSSTLCKDAGCLRYEARGVPMRDAAGAITNAVVVITAFGFDERLDELWPDLVGPGRPLDSRRFYIVGVAPGADAQGHMPEGDALESLVGALFAELQLSPHSALIGASSYGAELALRLLAHDHVLTGPMLVCGGHDRPYEEPAMKAVRDAVAHPQASATDTWLEIARRMVPASYTPQYLADVRHASEHGLVEEAKRKGLEAALIERQAAHFDGKLSLDELRRRMDAAFTLEKAPLRFALPQRRVFLVANRQDRMMSVARVNALADRLRAAGAIVDVRLFDDELGHSALFRHVPEALEHAVEALLAL